MKITAIDFETANYSRISACSIGIAVLHGDAVTVRESRRIKPPRGFGWFREDFVRLHGITHADVADCAGFDEVFAELRPHLSDAVLVAHNAPFDMSVLNALCSYYGILFSADYICTLALSRRYWPQLPAHDLQTVADYLSVPFRHHEAGSDAFVASQIVRAIHASAGDSYLEGNIIKNRC